MFERITIETKDTESAEGEVLRSGIAKKMLESFLKRIGRYTKIERSEALTETAEIKASASLEKPEFPDDPEDLGGKLISLGGSSGVTAGYFNGELFVVKSARRSVDEEVAIEQLNREQLIDEYVADRIYEAMGFGVPISKIYKGGQYKVAKFVPGKDLNAFSKDEPEFEKIKSELQKGFVLDCLLANWDVAGTRGVVGGDNIRLGDDGRVYRLDNGGALRFRARGVRKGSDFGERVGELDSLKTSNKLFSSISDKEVWRQIDEILENQDKIFTSIDAAARDIVSSPEVFEELKAIIRKRLEYLKSLIDKKKRERKIDKGVYESVVTNNYFEDWDDVELESNPELREQIKANVIQAEKRNQNTYENAAADLGISVEEFKTKLQVKVEDMIARAEFFRATHLDVLERIMNVDGRWKSQFETGTSQGTLDPSYRAAQEMRMFGFNRTLAEMPSDPEAYYSFDRSKFSEEVLETNREKRPIYGYFSDEEHGAINRYGKIPPPTNVNGYGTVNFKIKKERALEKATITFHDSLSPGSDWPPTPAAKPHFTSFRMSYRGSSVLEEMKGPSVTNWGERYTEVQYHGGLTMDDVESIHVSVHNGITQEDVEEVRRIFARYKETHPESTIQLIEF